MQIKCVILSDHRSLILGDQFRLAPTASQSDKCEKGMAVLASLFPAIALNKDFFSWKQCLQ